MLKFFTFVLFHLFLLITNSWAENHLMYNIKEINEERINKTVSDSMIEKFYNNPKNIEDVDNECMKVMTWVDTALNYGMEKYYHQAILCLTWEINKKLNKEQIELLASLKSAFNSIIFALMSKEHVAVLQITYIDYECTLMLVKKIYNTVYSTSLPICFKNPVFDNPDRQSSICNAQYSSHLSDCLTEEDAKNCMNKKIIEAFSANFKQKTDIFQLNNLTDKFILSLYKDRLEQNIKIFDFYDFYIRLIEDIAYEIKYTKEHNI